MNYILKHFLIVSILFSIGIGQIFAEKKKAKIKIEFYRDSNGTERLEAILIAKENRYIPQSDALIQFYSVTDSSRILLDKIKTNEDGKAIYLIENSDALFMGSTGFIFFEMEYAGNSLIKGAHKKIKIKRGQLKIFFLQKDSIKTIEVIATQKGIDKLIQPLKNIKVKFYIQGTFSLLFLGEEKTDENGMVNLLFPDDMPGDTAGFISIVAKIEEHKKFGNIETTGDINWAIPIQPVLEKQRGLGDTDAPLWMVYTLIFLLSFVWFSFLYVIYLITKIKLARSPA